MDDVIVTPTDVIGMPLPELAAQLRRSDLTNPAIETSAARAPPCLDTLGSFFSYFSDEHSVFGLRSFLGRGQGTGYWDFFNPSPHLFVSVLDATYARAASITVPGDRMLKIRLLLSGTLCDARRRPFLENPGGQLYVIPGEVDSTYLIAPDKDTKLVVLHFHPELLTETLGLKQQHIPAPLDLPFRVQNGEPAACDVNLTPDVLRAACEIVNSRYRYSNVLRRQYLEIKSHEIICAIAQQLSERVTGANAVQCSARDLRCVCEARDIVTRHFVSCPTIPRLACMVGINQTKLKILFKELTGLTVFDFVQRCRMEKATELLLCGERSISEIAYAVGYDYPANFTHAFKRYYGYLPKAIYKHRKLLCGLKPAQVRSSSSE